MKIKTMKGALYLGTIKEFDRKKITLEMDGETYALILSDEIAAQLAKANEKRAVVGSFVGMFEDNDAQCVTRFRFRGHFRLQVPSAKDGESHEENIFIGRAARINESDRVVYVSLPIDHGVGDERTTEWFSLRFFKGTTDQHPVDWGEKALLELSPDEEGKKPFFWCRTGWANKYTRKDGTESVSYIVREFGRI